MSNETLENLDDILTKETIQEKLESEKVLVGILKDINCGIDRIATVMEWDKDYIAKPNQEGKIMDQDQDQGQEMSELAEEQQTNVVDQLTELVDLLAKDNEELSKIAAHIGLMNKAQVSMMEQVSEMSHRLKSIAEKVDRIAEQKAPAKDEVETEEPPESKPVTAVPASAVHLDQGNGFALCGVMGTPSQPFAVSKKWRVTISRNLVTCPECLAKMAAQENS